MAAALLAAEAAAAAVLVPGAAARHRLPAGGGGKPGSCPLLRSTQLWVLKLHDLCGVMYSASTVFTLRPAAGGAPAGGASQPPLPCRYGRCPPHAPCLPFAQLRLHTPDLFSEPLPPTAFHSRTPARGAAFAAGAAGGACRRAPCRCALPRSSTLKYQNQRSRTQRQGLANA